MPDRVITVTDAARRFSDLVSRVYYRGESVTLMRNAMPVARLVPVAPAARVAAELAELWRSVPNLGDDDALALERDIAEARRALPPAASPWE